MRIVRIVNGCYGHKPEGSRYVIPVSAGDPPIEVTDQQAERLVTHGVAVYVEAEHVDAPVATAATKPAEIAPDESMPSEEVPQAARKQPKTGKAKKSSAEHGKVEDDAPMLEAEDVVQ